MKKLIPVYFYAAIAYGLLVYLGKPAKIHENAAVTSSSPAPQKEERKI